VLRATLIYLSKAPWARNIVTKWRFARRAATRFVAGEDLEDATLAIKALNEKGIYATADHLGENVPNASEAGAARDLCIELVEQLHAQGALANASVKLSQLGLQVDYNLCLENVRTIADRATEYGTFVRMDMEDSPCVDSTLRIQRDLCKAGIRNTGVAIQAYLYRSEADVRDLLEEGARIRLCKGAYKEPPHVAFPHKRDVDANYDRLARMMMDAACSNGAVVSSRDGKSPALVALATHDIRRIEAARQYAESVGLPKQALEFQMLYGIRPDLQRQLASEGYPVRVYVPYGRQWYPYFVRRLAERPANLWFFVSNFLRGQAPSR